MEEALSLFESTIIDARGPYNKNNQANLSPNQFKLIDKYKAHDDIIVLEADKNMGGSTLLRTVYTHRAITEHLGDTNVYKPLSKHEATVHQNILRNKVKAFTRKWHALRVLTKAETIYLQRAVERNPTQFARFRMSHKVHKTPWKLCPIVCSAGTFINNLSCWLDYQLQKLKHLIPTYIKDSGQLHVHQPIRKTLFVTINLAKAKIIRYTNHKKSMETRRSWREMQQIHQPNRAHHGINPLKKLVRKQYCLLLRYFLHWYYLYFDTLIGFYDPPQLTLLMLCWLVGLEESCVAMEDTSISCV